VGFTDSFSCPAGELPDASSTEDELEYLPIGSWNLLEEEMTTFENAQAGSTDGRRQIFEV
jgi:hypothetical protein